MKTTLFKTHRLHKYDRGYTLIEILVVAALIIVLMGILVGVGRKMNLSAKRSHSKMILNICKSAADTYEAKLRPILHLESTSSLPTGKTADDYIFISNWKTNNFKKNAPDTIGNGKLTSRIELFVYKALKYEPSAKILKTLNQKQLRDSDNNGFLEVCDGFDNMIDYTAFVDHSDSNGDDDFLPEYPHTFFASPGINGKWGNAETASDSNEIKDNLYSFDKN